MPLPDVLYLGTNDGLRILRRGAGGGAAGWAAEAQALDNAPLTALAFAPDGSGDLLCATGVWGVWRSSPDGKEIREQNAGIANRELHAMAVAADRSAVYAGAAPPELYRSADGTAWQRIDSFRSIPSAGKWFYPVPPNYPNIRQIVADPADPRTLYVGVEVGGLFRTRDGGETWEDLTGTMDPDCHAIALHPDRPGRLIVATPRGPFVSEDGGRTWAHPWQDRKPSYSASVSICPGEPDLAVVGISRGFRGADATIWVTEDGGGSWREAAGDLGPLRPSLIRCALVHSRSEPLHAFAGTLGGHLLESRDGGRSWGVACGGLPPIRAILVA